MFRSDEHMLRQMEPVFRLADHPTAQEAVLAYLLDNADELFTEPQLREALGTPRTTTSVALATLARQGLIVVERIGRSGRYGVDTSDPLIRTLKAARAIHRVRSVVAPVIDKLDLVVLFGSASRGTDGSASDTDVLVVTRDVDMVESELARHQWLQPVVLTPERHMALIAEGGTFASETAKGIAIWERR